MGLPSLDPDQGISHFQLVLKTDAGYGHRRIHGLGAGLGVCGELGVCVCIFQEVGSAWEQTPCLWSQGQHQVRVTPGAFFWTPTCMQGSGSMLLLLREPGGNTGALGALFVPDFFFSGKDTDLRSQVNIFKRELSYLSPCSPSPASLEISFSVAEHPQ